MTAQIAQPKTRDEIEDLKRQWALDPCWDIDDVEGFEAHYDELHAYRVQMEKQWNDAYMAELRGFAEKMGCADNLPLAAHIRRLEWRINELEKELDSLR